MRTSLDMARTRRESHALAQLRAMRAEAKDPGRIRAKGSREQEVSYANGYARALADLGIKAPGWPR